MLSQTVVKLIADGLVIPIALLGAYALIFKIPGDKRFDAYARILMAGLTAFLVAKLLGAVYQPAGERPFELMGVSAGASYLNNPGFPSDHMLFTTAITLAVWFETRQKKLTILLAVLTALVGLGRVLALVHTPLDIFGGLLVALIGAIWYLTVEPVRAKKKAHG